MASSQSTKFVTFNNGQKYPILGLGTWQVISNTILRTFLCISACIVFHICIYNFQTKPNLNESEQIEIFEAVKSAIDIGYRHFDCAAFYNNEKSVGKAIAEKIKEGIVKREEIYVTSKVC